MSSLFNQGLFDNQGGLGLGQVSMAIMFNPPSKGFDKSHELASHVLAIRLYCSEVEASFGSSLSCCNSSESSVLKTIMQQRASVKMRDFTQLRKGS